MPTLQQESEVLAAWTRLGVLLGTSAGAEAPDLERLLLATARFAPGNARVFGLAVGWLATFGHLVARHRLKHLIQAELEPEHQATLGLLLDMAARHGAPQALCATVRPVCRKSPQRTALFTAYRTAGLEALAQSQSCPEAIRWNLYAPDFPPREDTLRPRAWVVAHNPDFGSRAAYKGDLRSSIVETLRHDLPKNGIASESGLARLCSATRPALREALGDLELENKIIWDKGRSGNGVRLAA